MNRLHDLVFSLTTLLALSALSLSANAARATIRCHACRTGESIFPVPGGRFRAPTPSQKISETVVSASTAAGNQGTGYSRSARIQTRIPATVADLEARQVDEDPSLTCLPPGVPRIGSPDKIMQNENEVVFLYDDLNGAFWRIVPVNGASHRDIQPTYLGDSIGWWEDDTLVVETVGFNARTWLTDDGSFHTENLRVIERLSRDGDTLHYQAIAHDPEVLAQP